jgi:hypothetical protein
VRVQLDTVDQQSVANYVALESIMNPNSWYIRQSTATHPFILVHQTRQQKQMLKLYGGTIVGMDATYKTTKWKFPLFLINVVTNHGHGYPVALFILQEETSVCIGEALRILRKWNPEWQPTYVMIDKSDAELNAISDVFDEHTTCLLCDFHRLQAWWRWLRVKDNGVPADRARYVFRDLSELAKLEDPVVYELMVEKFKSRYYPELPSLKPYLDKEWLSCDDLWAQCYRRFYHGSIDTNNYMESMNQKIKGKWLNKRVDNRMDSLLRVYCDKIAVGYDREYLHQNIKSLRFGALTRLVPLDNWCSGRPDNVVKELMQRRDSARNMRVLVQSVDCPELSKFWVSKSDLTILTMFHLAQKTGTTAATTVSDFKESLTRDMSMYHVDIIGGTCTCPDHLMNKLVCKHMFVILERIKNNGGVSSMFSFEDISIKLTGLPRLVIDMECCGGDQALDDPLFGMEEVCIILEIF